MNCPYFMEIYYFLRVTVIQRFNEFFAEVDDLSKFFTFQVTMSVYVIIHALLLKCVIFIIFTFLIVLIFFFVSKVVIVIIVQLFFFITQQFAAFTTLIIMVIFLIVFISFVSINYLQHPSPN